MAYAALSQACKSGEKRREDCIDTGFGGSGTQQMVQLYLNAGKVTKKVKTFRTTVTVRLYSCLQKEGGGDTNTQTTTG